MKIKDGWHNIKGYQVWVEDGRVLRGVSDGVTIYPYRRMWKQGYDSSLQRVRVPDGWSECSGISVDAFAAGVRRGDIRME